MSDETHRWARIVGDVAFEIDSIHFRGATLKYSDEPGPALGMAMSDQFFGGGSVSAEITFLNPSPRAACDLVLAYNPVNGAFLGGGLGNEILYVIHAFNNQWTPYRVAGEANRLEANRPYHLECKVRGSLVNLIVDGVEVCSTNLPFPVPQSQIGVWFRDTGDIVIRRFTAKAEQPRAFVVMQFTSPYNELFQEVVLPICESFGVRAVRADDTFGPGLIIADVVRQIDESKFVIAEITPQNPNVYYEVGYSHARGKPTILIAERKLEKLPFDVSPFRTLFYENSIDGKRRIEEGLKRHIKEVLSPTA
jgi:hypothetical protein